MAENRVDYSRIKYPLQVVAKKTSSENNEIKNFTTLSVEAIFNPPEVSSSDPNEKLDNPLEGFDSKFSRFKFSIVRRTEKNGAALGRNFIDASIRVDELAGIKAKSDAALQMEMMMQSNWGKNITGTLNSNSKKLDKVSSMIGKMGKFIMALPEMIKTGVTIQKPAQSAQTVPSVDVEALKIKAASITFGMGNLKGKTPLQVIIEDAEKGKTSLTNQKEFLAKNVAKYPKNQEQIDAIDAALALFAAGALKSDTGEEIIPSNVSNNLGSVEIYTATPRALVRKKDEAGLCPVYEMSITWNYGNRYPIELTIVNEKAPVNQKEGGQLNPVLSKRQDVVKETFRMSIDDWYDVLDRMVDIHKNFKQMYFACFYKLAKDINDKNRKNATVNNVD